MARWLVTAAVTVDAADAEAALWLAGMALETGGGAAGLESWRVIAPAMPMAPDAPRLAASVDRRGAVRVVRGVPADHDEEES